MNTCEEGCGRRICHNAMLYNEFEWYSISRSACELFRMLCNQIGDNKIEGFDDNE